MKCYYFSTQKFWVVRKQGTEEPPDTMPKSCRKIIQYYFGQVICDPAMIFNVLLLNNTGDFKLSRGPFRKVRNYHAIAYFALLAKDNKVRKLRVVGVLAYFLHRELSAWVKEHIWYQVYKSLYKFKKVF